MAGKRLGIQLDTMGLTPQLYRELVNELDGWCELVDASDLVRTLRLVKSPAELDYIRQAGQIVNKCRDVAIVGTVPGVDEGEIMGKLWYTVFTEDGDPPASFGTPCSRKTVIRRLIDRRSATVPRL
jgi:Xaa-Pro dipeptidase